MSVKLEDVLSFGVPVARIEIAAGIASELLVETLVLDSGIDSTKEICTSLESTILHHVKECCVKAVAKLGVE